MWVELDFIYLSAFWGCQSEPITIQAHLDQNIELECPKGVALSSTFYCYAHINGTRLNALKFSIDGNLVTEHTSVAGKFFYLWFYKSPSRYLSLHFKKYENFGNFLGYDFGVSFR